MEGVGVSTQKKIQLTLLLSIVGEEDTADVSFLLTLNKLCLLPVYFFSLVRKLSKCTKAKEVIQSHCFFMG